MGRCSSRSLPAEPFSPKWPVLPRWLHRRARAELDVGCRMLGGSELAAQVLRQLVRSDVAILWIPREGARKDAGEIIRHRGADLADIRNLGRAHELEGLDVGLATKEPAP